MRFFIICVWGIIFCACSTIQPQSFIADFPQKAVIYVNDDRDFVSLEQSEAFKKEYLDKYFSIWANDYAIPSKEEMFWGLNARSGFGESKREISPRIFDELESNMQIHLYPSRKQKAIMVKTANVRVLPTIKPRFSKIDGYPFDRWQNSLIFAFTPIIILHQDKTKEWLLIQSSFVSGWVKADEVAILKPKEIEFLRKTKNFLIPNKDRIPLYYKNHFVESARIGMLFPFLNNQIYGFYRDIDGYAVKIPLTIDRNDFSIFPLRANQTNIAQIADSLQLENYGWGGLYGNRDCSAFVRDVLMNLGIWLPRNSLAQVNYAKNSPYSVFMALPKENDRKLEILHNFAKPFRTIIWLKGHIMLYLGEYNGLPIVMHDVWGLSNKNGLEILGGISITTLDSKDSSSKTLLDRIESINIVID